MHTIEILSVDGTCFLLYYCKLVDFCGMIGINTCYLFPRQYIVSNFYHSDRSLIWTKLPLNTAEEYLKLVKILNFLKYVYNFKFVLLNKLSPIKRFLFKSWHLSLCQRQQFCIGMTIYSRLTTGYFQQRLFCQTN